VIDNQKIIFNIEWMIIMAKFKHMVFAILMFASVCLANKTFAESIAYGSWFVDVGESGGFIYAATVNDSGNFFGQYCYPRDSSCMWFLGMNIICKEGEKYPVLINSDDGASQLEVLCTGIINKTIYRYAFTNFDAVDNIVKRGLRVGFAFPLQSDQFKIVRFNLDGSSHAVTVMRELASEAIPSNVPPPKSATGTRDEVF
jgi:hypothetical protein